MGVDPSVVLAGSYLLADAYRVDALADRSAKLFLNSYEKRLGGASTALARREATGFAIQRVEKRVTMQVATENAASWNRGRERVLPNWLRIYKLWDAYLDKKTCPVCKKADGLIVLRVERFRDPITSVDYGKPGRVHPYCRCLEEYLNASEAQQLRRFRAGS